MWGCNRGKGPEEKAGKDCKSPLGHTEELALFPWEHKAYITASFEGGGILNSLILKDFREVYFSYHIIHLFETCNSMIFSKFTKLCNCLHNSVLEHIHHPKKIPHACLQLIP